MTWTHFWDMHSGGGLKEKWAHIYIEAPEDEARVIFYNRFGHSPDRVSCTCCGNDYSVSEEETLAQATAYHRNCDSLKTPRDPETGRFQQPQDEWFKAHYYLEPDEVAEAERRGWEVERNISARIGAEHGNDYGKYQTVEEYRKNEDVLVIEASEVRPDERKGSVPESGYVWVGA